MRGKSIENSAQKVALVPAGLVAIKARSIWRVLYSHLRLGGGRFFSAKGLGYHFKHNWD
jgi:hypothetical protein